MKANDMRNEKAREEFKNKASIIHNNKYDYSQVKYITCKEKVHIICPNHGSFDQTPNGHLTGHGCPKCKGDIIKESMEERNSRDVDNRKFNFIKNSNNIHNDKYDYSLVNYTNAFTPVTIICSQHGQFNQLPSNHLPGRGCPQCGINSLTGGYTKQLFEDVPKLKTSKSYLYVAKLMDKDQTNSPPFIKIGITIQPPKYRLSKLKSQDIDFVLISIKEMQLYDAFILEQKILQKCVNEKFFPIKKFAGYTECVKYSYLEHILDMLA